jgi:hypothetical protein
MGSPLSPADSVSSFSLDFHCGCGIKYQAGGQSRRSPKWLKSLRKNGLCGEFREFAFGPALAAEEILYRLVTQARRRLVTQIDRRVDYRRQREKVGSV